MRKRRFTTEQIIGFNEQADAACRSKITCRRDGTNGPTYYQWESTCVRATGSNLKLARE